ncbi:pyroglutamyl-peptidase 1 [Phlebotomus papatasi]|uniref:pyroglutamyl-peptidase 1 n=1 Tax=Phlebotomus papatasi TaxID=29031 RepID=UPI00248375FE|nr:pyroglutamyl-peptidase 1 [Phlebotomus papatasi]
MGSESPENLIFVTGFGPFAGHESCNASWEAVKLLPDEITVHEQRYRLQKREIPVVYRDVDRNVSEIWDQNPLLVIHCGVHTVASKVCLEKYAYKSSYCSKDWEGNCLSSSSADLCRHGQNCDKLETAFNVEKIAEDLNKKHKDIFCASVDVGRYLCGYIYVKSLDYNPSKTLFIHVPKVDVISPSEVQQGILDVIQKCLEQIRDSQ